MKISNIQYRPNKSRNELLVFEVNSSLMNLFTEMLRVIEPNINMDKDKLIIIFAIVRNLSLFNDSLQDLIIDDILEDLNQGKAQTDKMVERDELLNVFYLLEGMTQPKALKLRSSKVTIAKDERFEI